MTLDCTRFATGTNAADKYQRDRRQVNCMVDKELFDLIKAEALSQNMSISEVAKMCIELVLKP